MIGKKKYKDHVQDHIETEGLREAQEAILGDAESRDEEILSEFLPAGNSIKGASDTQHISVRTEQGVSSKEDSGIKQRDQCNEGGSGSSKQGTTTIIVPTKIKTSSELLWDEIENGINGKNSGIPMGFNRLNKYLGLRRSIFTIVGGLPGTGKTAFVDSAYVLNPYDWYLKNKHTSKVKFEVLYYSMERKKTYKLAKWLAMRIWNKEGILIPVEELLSWTATLSSHNRDLAKFYIEHYITEMMESGIITLLDGPQNPTGIYKHMRNHALTRGTVHEINEFEKIYVPNNDSLITNVVADHVGKIKLEKIGDQYNKKANIDKLSEYFGWARDFLHYSPIAISQFNRSVYSDIQMAKSNGSEAEPTLESFKDTGGLGEDCDVALALFNPYRYKLMDYMDYNIEKMIDDSGNNKFRSLRLIKNSYGTDDIRIGLGFLGEVGLFKETPKASLITNTDYQSIVNNRFFE